MWRMIRPSSSQEAAVSHRLAGLTAVAAAVALTVPAPLLAQSTAA